MSIIPQVALGSQGLHVPVQGLGCMGMTPFAGTGLYGQPDETEGLATIHRELGVNFLDTAYVYCPLLNERLVAKATAGQRAQYTIATRFGSYGRGGTGLNGYATTIASGRVTVPANCWKVVVVLPNGSSDVARIPTSTRVIAINTPNTTAIGTAWGAYRTSVDQIEAATGLDLLSAVSSSIQNTLEARTDTGATN